MTGAHGTRKSIRKCELDELWMNEFYRLAVLIANLLQGDKMKNKLKKIIIILTVGFLILNIGFIGSESRVMPYAEVVEEHDAKQF